MYFCGKSWTNLDKFFVKGRYQKLNSWFPPPFESLSLTFSRWFVGCVCWLWAMGKLVGMWLKKVAQTKADLRPMSRERATLYLD